MTCGIYLLNFEGTDKVYIGQSLHIEYRLTDHIRTFKNNTAAKKLYAAYLQYGAPTIEVLYACSAEELDAQETSYITEFNSVDNGFNSIREGGSMPKSYGEEHPGSKYSNNQVEQAFILLTTTSLTHQQVASATGISKNMINHIAIGSCHGWLQEKYPIEYTKLISAVQRGSTSAERGMKYPAIQDINGKVYSNILNIRAFAREHNIPYSSLNSLLNNRTKSTKGWTRV